MRYLEKCPWIQIMWQKGTQSFDPCSNCKGKHDANYAGFPRVRKCKKIWVCCQKSFDSINLSKNVRKLVFDLRVHFIKYFQMFKYSMFTLKFFEIHTIWCVILISTHYTQWIIVPGELLLKEPVSFSLFYKWGFLLLINLYSLYSQYI